MGSGSAPRAVCVALAVACLVVLVTGCGGLDRTDATPHWCKKPGIRFAGTTAPGVEVCFTLSPDARTWLEIGYRFVGTRGCPGLRASVYVPGPHEGSGPARWISEAFTAKIHSARASGFIKDSVFCGGKRFEWSARATRAVPAQALRNLEPEPSATELCTKPGIHYTGKTTQGGVKVCFTLNSYGSSLVESGWSFDRASGCDTGGLIVQSVEQSGDKSDLDSAGHFDDSFGHGLKGTVRGAKASGVLEDTDDCGSKMFKWSARRTPK